MKHEAIAKVFEKEMDRRQFFAHVGAALLAIVGITGLIKTLLDFGSSGSSHQKSSAGYSSSVYGGRPR